MSETRVEIADEPAPPGGDASPYRNLWVPLIVVPAGIVIAIVVVFALFGNLTGEERGIEENLELVVSGGTNQRDQALFNLARQSTENQLALAEGRELPWPIPAGFADRVAAALGEIDEDEYDTRLALASLLAGIDRRGVDELVALLDLGDGQDERREVRFKAISNLGLLGKSGIVEDPAVGARLLAFLEHDDAGLRTVAAAALPHLPGEGHREALVGLLGDSTLEVRGTAAVVLANLDPPAPEAAPVLRDLTDPAIYAAAREEDPRKYSRGNLVSTLRVQALEALAQVGRDEDWEFIEGLREDDDANVVDAVLRLLRDREDG